MILSAALILIHSWYPAECCHDQDCHPVPCDALVETKAGIEWRGYTFTGKQIRPSQDSQCHVCAWEYAGRIVPQGWCVFVNPGS